MSDSEQLRLLYTDNGNCRVYYRLGKRMTCFQLTSGGAFELLACSRDGEPEYTISHRSRQVDRMPDDDSSTTHEFKEWWNSKEKAVSQEV